MCADGFHNYFKIVVIFNRELLASCDYWAITDSENPSSNFLQSPWSDAFDRENAYGKPPEILKSYIRVYIVYFSFIAMRLRH